MTYAQVTNGNITAEAGATPTAARRLDTGQWVLALREASVAIQQACGWFAVTDAARPADTDTVTHDRSLELVAGVPTVVWTQRDWTPDEVVQRADDADRTAKAASVAQAVTWLRARADEGEALTVTSTNAVAVLGALVDNVAMFYDHFADFLEANRYG